MPKETKARTGSFEAQSRASPYPQIGSSSRRGPSLRPPPDSPTQAKDIKEWDEVRCPVCMEHPHNAVLLLCTFGDKGCHPFMCDTSYRHSNCLDQYKKAFSASSPEDSMGDNLNSKPVLKLSCPLCRGGVTGWTVVEPARRYMNSKVRSCSKESCRFTGSYGELRKHARIEHPLVKPSEADPDRERDWRRMERERDMGDLFSTFRSAIGGEYGRMGFVEEDGEISATERDYSQVAVLLILHVRAVGQLSGTIHTSVRSSRGLTARVSLRSHRGRSTALWGENYNEPEPAEIGDSASLAFDIDDDEDDGEVHIVAGGDDSGSGEVNLRRRSGPRRHRRQLRMSPEELDEDDWL